MIRERTRRFLVFYMKSSETPKLLQMAYGGSQMESMSFTNSSITTSLEFNMNEREEKLRKAFRKRERKIKDACRSMRVTMVELLQELEVYQSYDAFVRCWY